MHAFIFFCLSVNDKEYTNRVNLEDNRFQFCQQISGKYGKQFACSVFGILGSKQLKYVRYLYLESTQIPHRQTQVVLCFEFSF